MIISDQLVKLARLSAARGHIFYTDNWYTSIKLSIHMLEKYGRTNCGTVNATTTKRFPALHDMHFLTFQMVQRMMLCAGGFVKHF